MKLLRLVWLVVGVSLIPVLPAWSQSDGPVVNDITQLNPIKVQRILKPHSIAEIQAAVKEHGGPISIGGGRFSQGGQTATENALQLDMREFNQVLDLSVKDKTITVQPGITWRAIQDQIDPKNLSIKIMQTYSNFTVGGSLSVNVHGRYVGQGPLVRSVRALKVVLADGSLVACSPTENSELFYGVIGGYGGLGVIVEATLDLADNLKVERHAQKVATGDYRKFFFDQIRNDPKAVFHNGDIYPPDFDTVSSVTWYESDKPLTLEDRLIPVGDEYYWQPRIIGWIASLPYGRELREHVIDPWIYRSEMVVWRNHEASYDVHELEPASREKSTYVLQEYFVPVEHFEEFVPKMAVVFRDNNVDVLNVSIRHALPDTGTLLAWARKEMFAFVVYYRQGVTETDRAKVGDWTRQMIDAVLTVEGTYYLPYQPQATVAQFQHAYPNAEKYFALKARLDPQYKFRNKLWDRYYPSPIQQRNQLLDETKGYKRNEASTFFTIPEWYIVFNPEEYAAHIKDKPPSEFPYFSSIAEFWHLYANVFERTRGHYPQDAGSHLMLMVIGTSYTLELAVKGVYENTLGRLSEWVAGGARVQADDLIWKCNDDYVKFIYVYPWYEFPFLQELKSFWSELHFFGGGNFPRQLERSLWFSGEYAFKSAYGWLVGLGSQAAYEADAGTIYAVVERLPVAAETLDGRLKVLKRFDDGIAVIALPRYEPFREIAIKLAKAGVRFNQISGNQRIALTLITPKAWTYQLPKGSALFDSVVVTDPTVRRVVVESDVHDLSEQLMAIKTQQLRLEHLYDY